MFKLSDRNTYDSRRKMDDIPDNTDFVSRFGIPLIMKQSSGSSERRRRIAISSSPSDLSLNVRQNNPFFVNRSRVSSEITISVLYGLGPLLLIRKNGLCVSVTRLDNQCPKNCASPPRSRHRISPQPVANGSARSSYLTVVNCWFICVAYQDLIVVS